MGKNCPSAAVVQIRDAIFEAILDKFYEDPTLISFGEDLRDWGSAYGAYKSLEKSVPYERLFNASGFLTLLSQNRRLSALPWLRHAGRPLRARADVRGLHGLRRGRAFQPACQVAGYDGGAAEDVGDSPHGRGFQVRSPALPGMVQPLRPCAGLKVVYPVTPYDAKGLLNAAMAGTDPVIYLESQSLYGKGELFHGEEGVPAEYYEIPIGEPDIKRTGSDLTILTIGVTLYRALEAAERFEKEFGISVEVIDARSIVPFNYDKVIASVKKTGKIMVASDACQRNSVINDFAEHITSMAFDYLDAPVITLGARNWITPIYELEKEFFPQAEWFLDAYHQRIKPLPGYTPSYTFNTAEESRRAKLGV